MTRLHRRYMDLIMWDILAGRYPAGSLLPREVELVESFGVSRGVVRECLRGLEERGVVAVRHGRGAEVLPPERWDLLDYDVMVHLVRTGHPAGDLGEYLDCRMILEVEVAGLAAQRATPEQVDSLREAFDVLAVRARDQASDSSSSRDEYHEADIGFHTALAGASGNYVMARLIRELHRTSLPLQILCRPSTRRNEILSEHERILRAVERGDPEGARNAMADHLRSVKEYLSDSREEVAIRLAARQPAEYP